MQPQVGTFSLNVCLTFLLHEHLANAAVSIPRVTILRVWGILGELFSVVLLGISHKELSRTL